MKAHPSTSDSFHLGEQRRKQFPRSELAHWEPRRRTRDPLEVLEAAMAGRLPELAGLKRERMSASPFGFFRGAVPVMASDLSLTSNTGIETQLCGDAHVQNLGAYTGEDGRLIFDINDFDETIRGPFEWDLKRMATSILLAGADAGVKGSAARRAARQCLRTYCSLLHELAELPVLEAARFQVKRLAGIAPISKILLKAERSSPLQSLEKLTEKTPEGRRFRTEPPVLRRVIGDEAAAVLHALTAYQSSRQPERRRCLARVQPIDVAFKVVGTGSVGLRDYCVYFQGNGPGDPLFLQLKEEALSAYAPYLPQAAHLIENQGQRVVEGQRAMQLQSDPMLGWTAIDGRSYLVRQLNDHKASVDLASLRARDLAEYATVCGEMLARGHTRAGDASAIAGFLGSGKRFTAAILDFAEAYAAQTACDWKQLVAQMKQHVGQTK